MITFEDFRRLRSYPDITTARKKYVSALFRFGSFGGVVSFGNEEGGSPPQTKRRDTRPEEDHVPTTPQPPSPSPTTIRSRGLTIRPEQIDEYGFAKSIDFDECEVQEELRKYLPSKRLVEEIVPMFKTWRHSGAGRDVGTGTDVYFNETSELYESAQDVIRSFFRIPEAERLSFERPDMSTPVFLRDHCSTKDYRDLTECVPRVYYYFGACGIPIEDLILYLSNVPGFERLFPYILMRVGHPHATLESITRKFFEDDRYDVALYGILSTPDADGLHGRHMRFAVKDRQARKIVLFDPHGDFNVADKFILDYQLLSRVLSSLTEGLPVQIDSYNPSDRTANVVFQGFREFGGSDERIRNVPEAHLFSHVNLHAPPVSLSTGHPAVYKIPRESVHFTEVVRSTSNVANYGYEGDQPSEGTCSLISLMRAAFIVRECSKRPFANPIEFVVGPIDCHFAVFVSMLAQAFNYKPDNFKAKTLDSIRPGVRFSVEGVRDNIWLNAFPKNRNFVPVFKITRAALKRAAFVTQTDISTNPFKYRFKVVSGETTTYHPMLSAINLTCLNEPVSCRIVLEPLPANTLNVTIFVRHEDKRGSMPVPMEVILKREFIETRRFRDLPLGFPFDAFTQVLIKYDRVPVDTPLRTVIHMESTTIHPDILVIRKPSVIRVHHFSNLAIKPGHINKPDRVTELPVRPETTVGDVLSTMKLLLGPGIPDSDRFRLAYLVENRDRYPLPEEAPLANLFTADEFVFYKLRELGPISRVIVQYESSRGGVAWTERSFIEEDTTVAELKERLNEEIEDHVRRNTIYLLHSRVILDDDVILFPRYDLDHLLYM